MSSVKVRENHSLDPSQDGWEDTPISTKQNRSIWATVSPEDDDRVSPLIGIFRRVAKENPFVTKQLVNLTGKGSGWLGVSVSPNVGRSEADLLPGSTPAFLEVEVALVLLDPIPQR